MCDWCDMIRQLIIAMAGKSVDQYFSNRPDLPERFDLSRYRQGVCPCGTPLTPGAWHGSYPEFLCDKCINTLWKLNAEVDVCLMCGNPLPSQQIKLKKSMPRELQHAFCQGEGECRDLYTYIAGLVTGQIVYDKAGQGMTAIETVFGKHISINRSSDDSNLLIAQTVEPLALPEPEERIYVPYFIKGLGQLEKEEEEKKRKEPILAKYRIIDV